MKIKQLESWLSVSHRADRPTARAPAPADASVPPSPDLLPPAPPAPPQDLKPFAKPKIQLEQYPTSPWIAARVMTMCEDAGDISERVVCDLGCGAGMLSCAAAILEADQVIGVDIDPDALVTARENFDTFEGIGAAVELLEADVAQAADALRLAGRWRVDTVVTNPPFGTRCKGADVAFVRAGFELAPGGVVYSLHKSSTREHLAKVGAGLGSVGCEPLIQMKYDLSASYKFHKEKSKDIDVDLWRFPVPERLPDLDGLSLGTGAGG